MLGGGPHVDASRFITLCESEALQMVKTEGDSSTVSFHATIGYGSELGFLSRFLQFRVGGKPSLTWF